MNIKLTKNTKIPMGVVLKLHALAQKNKISLDEFYVGIIPPSGNRLDLLPEVINIICGEQVSIEEEDENEVFNLVISFFSLLGFQEKGEIARRAFFRQAQQKELK